MKAHYCVLDDDIMFLKGAESVLRKSLPTYEGHFVSSGSEACIVAETVPLVLFVIDVNLGAENGIEIFEKIKRKSPDSRVIFVTGDSTVSNDPFWRYKALDEGGVDFILKPIRWKELPIKMRNNLELMEYQYRLEERVQERTNMLIHADRLATVGTMVSSIVHEVSTPLTFIKANQETCLYAWKKIEKKIVNTEVKELFESLIKPSLEDSLQGVLQIESLLSSFRRFYKQEQRISHEDVTSVLKDVKTLVAYAVKKHSITFSINNELTESFAVKCTKQELLQIITNILTNAADALAEVPKSDRILSITLKNEENRYISIRISNSGPPIPADLEEHIFEPFFTTKPGEQGTGLGLYIVRQILQKAGGNIVLENATNDKKTVDFVMTIPLVNQKI